MTHTPHMPNFEGAGKDDVNEGGGADKNVPNQLHAQWHKIQEALNKPDNDKQSESLIRTAQLSPGDHGIQKKSVGVLEVQFSVKSGPHEGNYGFVSHPIKNTGFGDWQKVNVAHNSGQYTGGEVRVNRIPPPQSASSFNNSYARQLNGNGGFHSNFSGSETNRAASQYNLPTVQHSYLGLRIRKY